MSSVVSEDGDPQDLCCCCCCCCCPGCKQALCTKRRNRNILLGIVLLFFVFSVAVSFIVVGGVESLKDLCIVGALLMLGGLILTAIFVKYQCLPLRKKIHAMDEEPVVENSVPERRPQIDQFTSFSKVVSQWQKQKLAVQSPRAKTSQIVSPSKASDSSRRPSNQDSAFSESGTIKHVVGSATSPRNSPASRTFQRHDAGEPTTTRTDGFTFASETVDRSEDRCPTHPLSQQQREKQGDDSPGTSQPTDRQQDEQERTNRELGISSIARPDRGQRGQDIQIESHSTDLGAKETNIMNLNPQHAEEIEGRELMVKYKKKKKHKRKHSSQGKLNDENELPQIMETKLLDSQGDARDPIESTLQSNTESLILSGRGGKKKKLKKRRRSDNQSKSVSSDEENIFPDRSEEFTQYRIGYFQERKRKKKSKKKDREFSLVGDESKA